MKILIAWRKYQPYPSDTEGMNKIGMDVLQRKLDTGYALLGSPVFSDTKKEWDAFMKQEYLTQRLEADIERIGHDLLAK